MYQLQRLLLQLNPQSGEARHGLGNIAFDEKDYGSALKEYQAAAQLDFAVVAPTKLAHNLVFVDDLVA